MGVVFLDVCLCHFLQIIAAVFQWAQLLSVSTFLLISYLVMVDAALDDDDGYLVKIVTACNAFFPIFVAKTSNLICLSPFICDQT